MEKSTHEIKKHTIYAYSEKIAIKGYALVIIEVDDDYVRGVNITTSEPINFNMTRDEFLLDVDAGILHLVDEHMPKFAVKDMTKIYKKNLKRAS